MASQKNLGTNTLKTARINPNFQQVLDVDPSEVAQLKDQLTLVDVRRPDELVGELGHISGINHIVLDELGGRLSEVPKDRPVVFVCRSGARSATATDFALGMGYEQVYNMLGGMIRWNELNLPVERNT